MATPRFPDDQILPSGGRIVLIVMDGLGGLPDPASGRTELETAVTPHLDALASRGSLGVHTPVAPGITPGSGPAHLSIFGYDPSTHVVGRGALSALGVGMELEPGDVAARLNLATFDEAGNVSDRRAGRPSDEEARRVVATLRAELDAPEGVEIDLEVEKEHRVVLRLRGEGLEADVTDTDPLVEGAPDLECAAIEPGSRRTAEVVGRFLAQARDILADEPVMNGFLARGFASWSHIPGYRDRFGLRASAIAKYPMYRGVARLVGMEVPAVPMSTAETIDVLEGCFDDFDFHFLHFKDTDTRGHDGDFDGKVAAIEEIDALIPRVTALEPDVIVVTGDHSTPTLMCEHSWHPVPTLIASDLARPTADRFGESACRGGDLGFIHGTDLVGHALAHAGRLVKFGA
ncbi:MAG TPA: 2,3-bisphosphoglycerate-independent phosphoglycerate mutase [Longimicrobiales bacterium]|nr:2,3-bisphosphoglycerate-independent phosphoglycerate mutase [Longimicrobiales bacterium]